MKIGVIGCGNMGQALIRGMLKGGFAAPGGVVAWDADSRKLKAFTRSCKVQAARSNKDLARKSSIILLAVKPQQMEEVLEEIGPFLTGRKLVISIAAGIKTGWIERHLGRGIPIVRVMPNTPALVGEGMSAIAGGRYANASHIKVAQRIFACVGEVVRVPEKWMNAVTAVSGSGPAYFFYLMEEMIRAGVELGLPRQVARQLVVETAAGAASMAASSKEEPKGLRAKVTSKGGTTEAAFKVFAKRRLEEIDRARVKAAAKREREISKERQI
jgi:pyrroline-5-carboxylate reductase